MANIRGIGDIRGGQSGGAGGRRPTGQGEGDANEYFVGGGGRQGGSGQSVVGGPRGGRGGVDGIFSAAQQEGAAESGARASWFAALPHRMIQALCHMLARA